MQKAKKQKGKKTARYMHVSCECTIYECTMYNVRREEEVNTSTSTKSAQSIKKKEERKKERKTQKSRPSTN